ncbi:hypothetical protein [Paraburkholderia bannensis]|nr:hypothetical protein [Paraburkholderia bannensis]
MLQLYVPFALCFGSAIFLNVIAVCRRKVALSLLALVPLAVWKLVYMMSL